MENDLIFDIGVHRGDDSRYYLAKGFRVVGVEANPVLCDFLKVEFADDIASGRFSLVEEALSERSDETISFYVNRQKDDWSSAVRGAAEKGLYTAEEISVQTTTLADIIKRFGIPHFVKCDIEGNDAVFVRQLQGGDHRPAFVSIEATSCSDLAFLHAAGYDRFQIVNQQYNHMTTPPDPAREGVYTPWDFTAHTSGLFGRELNPYAWITFDDAVERFIAWNKLRLVDSMLATGWLDFHAARADALT